MNADQYFKMMRIGGYVISIMGAAILLLNSFKHRLISSSIWTAGMMVFTGIFILLVCRAFDRYKDSH